MIVDTHVHAVSDDKIRYPLLPGTTGWPTSGVTNPIEEFVGLMARFGVDRVVLTQSMVAYGPDNSYHADSTARYPGRTVAVGLIDPSASDAADKLSYWITERGMHGARLAESQEQSDHTNVYAVWKRAETLGVPLVISGGGRPDRIEKLRNLAERFSGVSVVPDNMAGWNNAGDQRVEVTQAIVNLAALPNVYLKIMTPTMAGFEDLDPAEQTMFRRIVDTFTPQRLMWGSNYPASREGGYGALVEVGRTALPFLSSEDRRWFLGETALKVWPGLSEPVK